MSNNLNIDAAVWRGKLASLTGVIEVVGGIWVDKKVVLQTLNETSAKLESDLEGLKPYADFIFAPRGESENLTDQNVELLRRWHLMEGPSLSALCILAMEHFKIRESAELINCVLLAGVLGEINNDLAYHNNMHYRKVLLQTMRMIAVHNDIYHGTSRAFGSQQIGMLLIAACIHDLGHDGKGNTVKGVFEQGRLEKRSFDLAATYLRAAGLQDQDVLESLRVMILSTEVTPLGDPGNSMSQMKAAYRFHFQGHKSKTHTLNLDPDLSRLQTDSRLTMMSLILHEADIATSAGLTYPVTKFETTIYMREIKKEDALPQHVVDFLNQICQRQMLSDAAQRLYAANMARIYVLAEEDIRHGDVPFPSVEQSDFLQTHGRTEPGAPRTIN